MKKSKIKMLTVFSSITMILGMTTGCSKQENLGDTNKENQEVVVGDATPDEEISKVEEETITDVSENVYDTSEKFSSESDLLNFIQSGTERLKEIGQSEPIQHVKDTIIHSGLALSDFLLLDKPIGGMSLSDLTDKGKEVVIDCLFAVDTLAQEKVPEQYESLKEKTVQIKNKFKEVLIDIIGEENYEYFGELKDKAIDKGKDFLDKGKQKYKNWREN